MAQVVLLARYRGWWCFHDHDSRLNAAGLPDLLLVRPPRVLWVELKAERGRLRPQQEAVIALLREAGQDVRVWRPRDWIEVTVTLEGA